MQLKVAEMDVAFYQVNAQLIEVRYNVTLKSSNSTPKMNSVHFSKFLTLVNTFVFLFMS